MQYKFPIHNTIVSCTSSSKMLKIYVNLQYFKRAVLNYGSKCINYLCQERHAYTIPETVMWQYEQHILFHSAHSYITSIVQSFNEQNLFNPIVYLVVVFIHYQTMHNYNSDTINTYLYYVLFYFVNKNYNVVLILTRKKYILIEDNK